MMPGKIGVLAVALTASHLLTPSQFAHMSVARNARVLDVRGGARPVVYPYKQVARAHLVAIARSLVADHRTVLVIDHADRAPTDARRLQEAGITSAFVLRNGAHNYRAMMRFGTY